jgi:hypothetical protein
MKKITLLVIAIIGIVSVSYSQARKQEWATIKTPNVRCWECKQRLEDYMAREIAQTQSGITKMQINLISGTTRVQYWTDRVSLNYIQTAFANAGFDADTIKANEDSYKKLPPACKRVEEGGGPKKGKPCHQQPF